MRLSANTHAGTINRKIKKKTRLVRSDATRYTRHKRPIKTKKNAKVSMNWGAIAPSQGIVGSGAYAAEAL
jgi:hypothetical protein